MAEYAGRLPLFHIDLYRLADAGDALAGGLIDDRQASGLTARRVAGPDGGGAAGRTARRAHRRRRVTSRERSPSGPASPALRALPGRAPVSAHDGRRHGHPGHRHAPRLGSSWRPVRPTVASTGSRPGRPATDTARRCWPTLSRFLGEQNIRRSRLAAIVVGTGPGRLHRAARRDRHGQGPRPRSGRADRRDLDRRGAAGRAARRCDGGRTSVLLLPAGPSDRILVRRGRHPSCCRPARDPDAGAPGSRSSPSTSTVAPRPTPSQRGELARDGLGAALIRLGAARLARGATPTTWPGSCPST